MMNLYSAATGFSVEEANQMLPVSGYDVTRFNKTVSAALTTVKPGTTISMSRFLVGTQGYYLMAVFFFEAVLTDNYNEDNVPANAGSGILYVHDQLSLSEVSILHGGVVSSLVNLTMVQIVDRYHGYEADDYTSLHSVTDTADVERLKSVQLQTLLNIGVSSTATISEVTKITQGYGEWTAGFLVKNIEFLLISLA